MSQMSGMSGRDIGVRNLSLFNAWVTERQAASDWAEYIRGDKLNRSEIAAECGFALSVLRQNPAIKNALAELEESLKALGVITAERQDDEAAKSDMVVDRRIMAAKKQGRFAHQGAGGTERVIARGGTESARAAIPIPTH